MYLNFNYVQCAGACQTFKWPGRTCCASSTEAPFSGVQIDFGNQNCSVGRHIQNKFDLIRPKTAFSILAPVIPGAHHFQKTASVQRHFLQCMTPSAGPSSCHQLIFNVCSRGRDMDAPAQLAQVREEAGN
jgi:hypothetical protein